MRKLANIKWAKCKFLCVLLLFCLFSSFPLLAHIGTINTIYETKAGPYSLRVIIEPNLVVPAPVSIIVRNLNPQDKITQITALPVKSDLSKENEPPADVLVATSEDPNVFTGQMPIFTRGLYDFYITVKGIAGEASVKVPFESIQKMSPGMEAGLKAYLFGIGLFILSFILYLAFVVGRDGLWSNAMGNEPSKSNIKQGGIGVLICLVAYCFTGVQIYHLYQWQMKQNNDKILKQMEFTLKMDPKNRVLTLIIPQMPSNPSIAITEQPHPKLTNLPAASELNPAENYWVNPTLIPDHGKWMHLFLVRSPSLDIVAHLHPSKINNSTFQIQLPDFPSGSYLVYGDIVFENGFSYTLTGKVEIPDATDQKIVLSEKQDSDDAWAKVEPANSQNAHHQKNNLILEDGSQAQVGKDIDLKLNMINEDDKAMPISLYMGMKGHAFIMSKDHKVFAHIHPTGTIPMATLQKLTGSMNMDGGMSGQKANEVDFPFVFPKAGEYRMWVQVKVGNKVLTGAYDINVKA